MRASFRTFLAAAIGPSVLATMLLVAEEASASGYTFTAVQGDYGINNAGQIVGEATSYNNGNATTYGILNTGGNITVINPPTSTFSEANGINNVGQVVGNFNGSTGQDGFIYSNGRFTIITDPGNHGYISPYGINDSGQIVGQYAIYNGPASFIETGGVFTTILDPGAQDTWAYGINNSGVVAGTFYDGSASHYHGFTYVNGSFTTIDDPSASGGTWVYGVNNVGQLVGNYIDGTGNHGFVDTAGSFVTIDDPATYGNTNARGINDAGQVVGIGFVATPGAVAVAVSEPVSMAVLATGALGLAIARGRRRRSVGPASQLAGSRVPSVDSGRLG